MNQWAVLECLVKNENLLGTIIEKTKSDYFYDDLPKSIYSYILDLYKNGSKPNLHIITSKFPGYEVEIKDKLSAGVDPANIDEYLKNLRSKYITVTAHELGDNLSKSKEIDEKKFVNYIDKFLADISVEESSSWFSANDIADNLYNSFFEEQKLERAHYHVEDINDITNGMSPTDLIILAGRPNMGKSGVMGFLAFKNALGGVPTLLISLEMSRDQYAVRMFSAGCDTEIWKLKRLKSRPPEEQKQAREFKDIFKNLPLVINDTPSLDLMGVRTAIQKFRMQYKDIGLVLIDYIQLMDGAGENANSRLTEISKNLKSIAKMYEVPIVVGSQLSRLCELRDNKRPILSDLRESGAIEQDADIVIMLYRDSYYTQNPETADILEVNIAKARNGPIGRAIIEYDRQKQTLKKINPNSQLGAIAKRFEYI